MAMSMWKDYGYIAAHVDIRLFYLTAMMARHAK